MKHSQELRVLFILKHRQTGPYGAWNYSEGKPLPSGLMISATQMCKGLDDLRIENKLVHVIDNNGIDREVHQYKPTHVIIEAFWVVPEKFDVLKKLHPNVTWVVRNHSKLDFLANEGNALGWAIDYMKRGVVVASNSPQTARILEDLAEKADADPSMSIFLPNYYKLQPPKLNRFTVWVGRVLRRLGLTRSEHRSATINVGCFGAIRPLKNHLSQATAAIKVADSLGKALRFYINSNRIEGKADAQLKSLQELFKRYPKHTLVEIGWQDHQSFVQLTKQMDVVMQVSVSETFNIVSADAVAHGVPVVTSCQIPWLGHEFHADPISVDSIAKKLRYVLLNNTSCLKADQRWQLYDYGQDTLTIWSDYLYAPKYQSC